MPVRAINFKPSRKTKLKLRKLAKRYEVSINIEESETEKVYVRVMKILQSDYAMNFQISDRSSLYEEIEEKAGEVIMCYRMKLPIVLFEELSELFKKDYSLIARWFSRPKAPLEGKRPIDVLKEDGALDKVMGMLERMKTGDFS